MTDRMSEPKLTEAQIDAAHRWHETPHGITPARCHMCHRYVLPAVAEAVAAAWDEGYEEGWSGGLAPHQDRADNPYRATP